MIRKIQRKLYLYLLERIKNKLFPKWKAEEKELRRKHLQHGQGAHYKLWWAAMREMEKRQEKEYQQAIQKIEWLRPSDQMIVSGRGVVVSGPKDLVNTNIRKP
jgi:CRISPR/Cas system CMR subunit Cmr6 (Cas7 group RAMP superfamily)